MLFYVLTDVMFVIFLLVSYVWLRAYHVTGWFHKGIKVPDEQTVYILAGCGGQGVFFFIGFWASSLAARRLMICMAVATALLLPRSAGRSASWDTAVHHGRWLIRQRLDAALGLSHLPPAARHLPWHRRDSFAPSADAIPASGPWRDHHRLLLVLDGVDAGDCDADDDRAAAEDKLSSPSPAPREEGEIELRNTIMWSVLADWTLQPTVIVGLAVAALLSGRGVIYSRQHGQATRLHWWHVLAFYGGLLVLFIALESALDDYAEQLLWAHMIQQSC